MMNETLEVIRTRRSVRSYQETQISEEVLQAILEAGTFAPSGNHLQPWHFTVIQNKKLLKELNNETKGILSRSDNPFLQRVGNNEELDIFNGAPTVVVVSGNEANVNSVIECALASQNMMLAAKSLGVSSCYIVSFNYLFEGDEAAYFKEKVGIPEENKVYNTILLGYAKEGAIPEAAPRKEDNINYIR